MRSEEQWEEIDRCPDCNSPIYEKGDETKFTGPPGCCWRPKETKISVGDPLADKPNARPHPGS